jgi:hypothetical protein
MSPRYGIFSRAQVTFVTLFLIPLGFFLNQDEFIKSLSMSSSFMQSIYRDDTTVDSSLEVIWYSSMLTANVFADLLVTGRRT